MKKSILVIIAMFAMASAQATQGGNTPNKQGGDSASAASAASIATALAASSATALAGESTSTATSTSGGNSIVVGGDMAESNTPPVVAGVLPSAPTSCRLYLFGGGSTRDGAGSGTFPIGNDQTCLSIASLNLMERAGGFTQAEKQTVVCKVEGMADFPTCKAIGK
jgi:hypothetical protein